jgi:hypothetical protein
MMPTKTTADLRLPTLTSRLAAACRDPRHHCALVLAVNASLAACAATEPFTPTLLLHLALLPINAWRLRQALRVGAPAQRPAASMEGRMLRSTLQKASSPRDLAFDARTTIQTIRLSPVRRNEA